MNIVVNASALRTSGALTILLQFISEIPNGEDSYYIFVHKSVEVKQLNPRVHITCVDKTTFIQRFIWDFCGLNSWLKANCIVPDIAISLQNTNFRLSERCKNYIYYHQPLPFYDFKWNVFRKHERNLWFYKNVYPFFVKMFINEKTEFFVQLNYIKECFSKTYKVDKDRIHVVFPNLQVQLPNNESENLTLNPNNLNLFYPATSQFYKNHKTIFDALQLIDLHINRKIDVYLTNEKSEFNFEYEFKNIEIKYMGKLSYEKVIWYYCNAHCLLFPSYIETLGMPLIEAASCGIKIIASDLPYAREVLDGYKGVVFVNYNDPVAWSELILSELKNEKTVKYDKFSLNDRSSWNEFFKIIKLKDNV